MLIGTAERDDPCPERPGARRSEAASALRRALTYPLNSPATPVTAQAIQPSG
jgi:hypothetical protein